MLGVGVGELLLLAGLGVEATRSLGSGGLRTRLADIIEATDSRDIQYPLVL